MVDENALAQSTVSELQITTLQPIKKLLNILDILLVFVIELDGLLAVLILDEIIMANSSEARNLNRELKEMHKDGILEKIYERQDSQKQAEAAAAAVASPSKSSPKDTPMTVTIPKQPPIKATNPVDPQEPPESPTKKP